jgi:hypothetical protein
MADTKHLHAAAPVEGDGVSYSGIVWFVAVLVGTVIFCEVFVWGLFRLTESQAAKADVTRAPLAAPVSQPSIEGGRLVTGSTTAPQPGLLVTEPTVLKAFRDAEDKTLNEYGWIDQSAGTVRLPIDRAKDVLLSRGLPVRSAAAAAGGGQ